MKNRPYLEIMGIALIVIVGMISVINSNGYYNDIMITRSICIGINLISIIAFIFLIIRSGKLYNRFSSNDKTIA